MKFNEVIELIKEKEKSFSNLLTETQEYCE